jgi:hypothetical protein
MGPLGLGQQASTLTGLGYVRGRGRGRGRD